MEPSPSIFQPQRQQEQQQTMAGGPSSSGFSSNRRQPYASLRPHVAKIRHACGSAPGPVEIMEVITMGARSPLRFVERSISPRLCNGSSPFQRDGGLDTQQRLEMLARPNFDSVRRVPLRFKASTHASENSNSSRSCTRRVTPKTWYRRISAPPLDAVCFTLMGISVSLRQPGVDPWAVAKALVDSSVDLRTRNARGMTPLHLACQASQVDVAKVLLLAGADTHARDRRSRCPLHLAALTGSERLVAALLASGADPQKASESGTTPLHNAALRGHVGVTRALLLAGASADVTDSNTFSPLYLAAQNGHTQVVLDLLTAEADAAIKTTRGFTPLHVAARCGHVSVLRALSDKGVPVDCVSTPAANTPLHLAAGFSRADCVRELLQRGADSSKENQRGFTPFDLVGSLLPPPGTAHEETSASDSDGLGGRSAGSPVEAESSESRQQNFRLVRSALLGAQAWSRRRNAVLVCETLSRRATLAMVGRYWEQPRDGEVEKRAGYREFKRNRHSLNAPWTSGDGAAAEGGGTRLGWVVEQLCAQPEAKLMKNVIRFL